MTSRRPQGFTLIELMVVVAIIGILSSVAIPSYKNFQLRSKQAERVLLLTSIQRSIDDMYMRNGGFPWDWGPGSGITYLYLLSHNPDANPGTAKRPWRLRPLHSLDHWNQLSIVVQGSVYYSYYGYAYTFNTAREYDLQAIGDLDGDRIQNVIEERWSFAGTKLQTYAGGTYKCSYCSIGYETNPRNF
jgi:prepilin-type N-terminal cleavage/methylation domain-containing protein